MYCRVLACDFDGTGAANGGFAPEVAAALGEARQQGIVTLLVTGRVLEDLTRVGMDFGVFDAVVAENGAIVLLPAQGRTLTLGTPPPERFLGRLREAGIVFHAGAVVVGTWEQHAAQALALVREMGVDLQLVFNRAAVMLLPSGVNKAVGVQRALDELGRSPRNMIAFGDAENDLPLFALAEIGVAARGAVPAVAAAADERLSQPGASGVAQCIQRVLANDGWATASSRHDVVLGEAADGSLATLPAGEANVLVSGDPRSGKSWLAGLVAERMLADGYRLCLLDPEGDYASLASRPGMVLLGQRLALPAADDVPQILTDLGASLVLSLTDLPQGEKCRYVCTAVEALARERARSGLPHWTIVDEAHYFFQAGSRGCAELLAHTGNVMLVTYRPSMISPEVHDAIGVHLVTRTEIDSERYFMESLLAARGPASIRPADALREIVVPHAGLLTQTSGGPRWQTFVPGLRAAAHVHHGRKYVETTLDDVRAFRFSHAGGGTVVTHNVREFAEALARVPIESLRQHLRAGDFSRWSREVLGDADLAAGLAKIERTVAAGGEPSRQEVIRHVRDRYVI